MPDHSHTAGASDCRWPDAQTGVFTPEEFSSEQLLIRDLAGRFMQDEVMPQQDRIERQEWDVTVRLLKRCAELGLVGIEIPERYGGSGLGRVSAMIAAEQMARSASFSVSFGGQSGIGTLPILYFGSEYLRNAYLPQLCSAGKLSAYALSEAGSGSDALSAKASAVRSADGSHWILNGEKMWVTNAAFADVFITFAQVDGNQFSCFVVEKSYPGVSTGAEERKMGLKGSSTRPLVLCDVPVPVENLVGEIGKGHEVALNILNIGRAKLGASAVGAGKTALHDAVQYAKQRMAFGKSISSFGAIRHKLAEMAIRIWIAEGMVYRTAHLMDQRMQNVNIADRAEVAPALREYAVECSIVKVFGSEMLGYVADEAVQIFGGYGFTAEYPVERYYRDSRVTRIFEGTNEMNRLMISRMLMKKLPKIAASSDENIGLSSEAAILGSAKLALTRIAAEAIGQEREEQELQMLLANIAIGIYAMDTGLHRTRKIIQGGRDADTAVAMFRTFVNDEIARITFDARQAMAALGMENAVGIATIEPLMHWTTIDTIAARRRIAEQLLG